MDNVKIYHGGGMGSGSGFPAASGFTIGGTADTYYLYKDDANNVDYGFDWLHYQFSPINLINWRAITGCEITTIDYVQLLKMFANDEFKIHFGIPWNDFTYMKYCLVTLMFAITDSSAPDTKKWNVKIYTARDTQNWRSITPAGSTEITYSYPAAMSNSVMHIVQKRVEMVMSTGTGPKFVQFDLKRTDATSGDPMICDVCIDFPVKKVKPSSWWTSGTPMTPPV